MSHDPSEARYLRKKHAVQGVDQEQEEQQKQFGKNLQKALDVYGKKNKKQDIESQVQYFGNMIEPFNMREEQQMGDIDQEGYFVFKRRGQYRDAWLDSIEEGNDMMVADKVKKKIKTEGVTYKGVYDEDKKGDKPDDQKIIDQVEEEQQNDNQQEEDQDQNNHQVEQEQEQQEQAITLQPDQIKQLICQLLPMNKSANMYIKQLKKKIKDSETKQLHDKILELCNMYIQKTQEYDILTSKKEQLEIEVGGGDNDEEKSEEINWDDQGEDDQKKGRFEDNQKQRQNIQTKQSAKPQQQQRNNQDKAKHNNNHNKMSQDHYSDDDIF